MKEILQLLNHHIIRFDFILILIFICQVLIKTKILAEKLQTEKFDLVIANTKLRVTCNILYTLAKD
jgi:hypothetical protein